MVMSATLKNSKKEILNTLGANEAKIKSFGVRSLSLFGSSVRGEDKPESDLDFVVEFEKKSFDAYMDLKLFLEELFDRPVDLVLADGIKPRLRAAILREAIHAPGL
jgi:predicted nucleotidyltransferase